MRYICPICHSPYWNRWNLAMHIVNQTTRAGEHNNWLKTTYPDVGDLSSFKQRLAVAKMILQDMEYYNEQNLEDVIINMYREVRKIEIRLHEFIRAKLIDLYGGGEEGWWQKGIPEKIRKNCAVRREEEKLDRQDLYSYTDLIDLKEIIEKNWSQVFSQYFECAPVKSYFEDKGDLLEALNRLNAIRNRVMHPIRYLYPEKGDLEFLKWRSDGLSVFIKWVAPPTKRSRSWKVAL